MSVVSGAEQRTPSGPTPPPPGPWMNTSVPSLWAGAACCPTSGGRSFGPVLLMGSRICAALPLSSPGLPILFT